MEITEEMLRDAEALTAIAPGIALGAEIVLRMHGVDDPDKVIPALLSAAWTRHKEEYGEDTKAVFAGLLRSMADGIDAMSRPN